MHDGGIIRHLSISGQIGSGGVRLRGTGCAMFWTCIRSNPVLGQGFRPRCFLSWDDMVL